MGNLWVAISDTKWIRADRITHVYTDQDRHSTWPPKFDVMVGTTMLSGGWRFYHEEPGHGNLDHVTHSLHRGESEETARILAELVLRGLIAHADRSAVLQIVGGKVVLNTVADQ